MELEGRALFVCVTALTCSGFLLIGYDNGLMGGMFGLFFSWRIYGFNQRRDADFDVGLVNTQAFKGTFGTLRSEITGLIVAIYEVGCFLGSLATSIFGEQIGRKKSIFIGIVVMIIGAILQAAASSVGFMIFARIFAGVGMGKFYRTTRDGLETEHSQVLSTVPYLSFSRSSVQKPREDFVSAIQSLGGICRLIRVDVCMQVSTLNFGIFLAYWIDYAFTQSHTASFAWRVPAILQCMFLISMLVLLFVIPESPRWLINHGRPDEALRIFQRLHKHDMSDSAIRALHADIKQTAEMEASFGAGKWSDIFVEDAISSRRRFFIACGIQSFQQLGGINALIYYSSTLFASIGFDDHMSALMSGFLQTFFFLASFIPWVLIDRKSFLVLLNGKQI